MAKLTVSQLGHQYGPVEVLRDLSFELKAGRVISVVGSSGCGKTTLLHLCAGLLECMEGEIVNEFELQAFAFQEARLLPWTNALNNIAFGLKAKRMPKTQRMAKAKKMARAFGLSEEDLLKFPKDLSGGMKQRVSFARALVIEPSLLFLDEPFSALDIGLKQALQQRVIEEVESSNLAILFITHDLSEAVKLSHEVLVMDSDPGRVVKHLKLDRPLSERDEDYIHHQTQALINDPLVQQSFELTLTIK